MLIDIYVHADKETMHDVGEKAGLPGVALEIFKYAGYEIKLTLDVNKETGISRIVKVDDLDVGNVCDRVCPARF